MLFSRNQVVNDLAFQSVGSITWYHFLMRYKLSGLSSNQSRTFLFSPWYQQNQGNSDWSAAGYSRRVLCDHLPYFTEDIWVLCSKNLGFLLKLSQLMWHKCMNWNTPVISFIDIIYIWIYRSKSGESRTSPKLLIISPVSHFDAQHFSES